MMKTQGNRVIIENAVLMTTSIDRNFKNIWAEKQKMRLDAVNGEKKFVTRLPWPNTLRRDRFCLFFLYSHRKQKAWNSTKEA